MSHICAVSTAAIPARIDEEVDGADKALSYPFALFGAIVFNVLTMSYSRRSICTMVMMTITRLAAPIVKELAGHADIKTTLQYYVTIRGEDLVEAAQISADALTVDPKQGPITDSA